MIIFNGTNQKILGLLLCSASLLIIALYFEYVLGLLPCKLCLWQRLPHATIVLLGVVTLINNAYRDLICFGCLLAIFLGLLISGYHVGIEYKLWPGPIGCSGNNTINTLTPDLFLESILKTPIIRCDEVKWLFLKISMAGWNFLISFALTILWAHVTLNVLRTRII